MRALFSLALALILGARPAPAEEPSLVLSCEPQGAVVGEPLRWKLVLEAPAGARYELAAEDPLEGLSEIDRLAWAVVEGPRSAREPLPGGGERRTFEWVVLALESGQRPLPALAVHAEDGSTLTAEAPEIEIWSDLREDEDVPRPLAGLHDIELGRGGLGLPQLAGALLVATVLGGWWWRRRRARPAPAIAAGPSARERLLAWKTGLPSTPEEGRGCALDLAHALREAAERPLGRGLAGLADEEWLALCSRAPTLAPERQEELAGHLRALEAVAFGGEQPTRFRLEELLQHTESLLAELDRAPAPRAEGEAA